MEDLAVYQRLNEINHQRAAMGLGFDGGCADAYIQPDYIGGEMYGGGRKLSNYNRFVCAFAKKNKGKYRKGSAMLKAAAAAWRKCSKSGKCKSRYSSKRAPYGCKRSGARGKSSRRKRGGDMDDMFGGDMYDMGGILIGGAKKKRKTTKRRKPRVPTAAQLRNLGMTPYEFELMRLQTKQNPYGNLIPKYPSSKLARIGKRYSRRRNPNNNVCAYPNMNGPFLLDRNYDCVQYQPGVPSGVMKGYEQLNQLRALQNIAPPTVAPIHAKTQVFAPSRAQAQKKNIPRLALPWYG